MTIIEKLSMNVRQANSDFAAIKNKIIEKGVDVPDGTPTSDYGLKVDEVFEAGKQSVPDRVHAILAQTPFELTPEDFEGVETIKAYSFYANIGVTSVVMSDDVVTIEQMAFYSCNKNTNLVFGNRVESIGVHAFSGNYFASVILPDSLITLNSQAFFSCINLMRITIPKNVNSIGAKCFQWCSHMSEATFKGTPSTIAADAFMNSGLLNIYVPWAEGEVANAPWGATSATIHYNSEV